MCAGLLAVAMTAAALAAGDAGDNGPKKDLEKMQGAWTVQGITHDGNESPADRVAGLRLLFDGEKYTLTKDGDVVDEGTFKLDAGKKIDIQSTKGDMRKLNGIYQIDGDAYKEALVPDASERPTELTSKAGSGVILIMMRRDKK